MPGDPPQPLVVGSDGLVPQPCVLHPEQVTTYPFAGLLPEGLCARIDTWEKALEEAAERSAEENTAEPVRRQYDLPTHGSSTPTGVTVGRFGELDVFVCPADPDHPHGGSVQ
ncbi:hypothetical protein SNE510_58090 [Streptomyces sp. NE5-10]|uniref:hypothetical protein n=1 Tax=Streptomyces sp. NE5-10 TaxID=2759674 RepID=UPI001A5D4598|nr:hypothetical protein [Streptomyces sp. NE5-10]GHJ96290.1 hypothetical protein SNE510_58090 [Streptomyces sp. NE5-10]